jgi:hypothetical protein
MAQSSKLRAKYKLLKAKSWKQNIKSSKLNAES